MAQGWTMPDGPSWDHPMSREDDSVPVNLTSGGYTFRYKVTNLIGEEIATIVCAIPDPEDEDMLDAAILEMLEINEVIDLALDEYYIQWQDWNHATVHYAPQCQMGSDKLFNLEHLV